MKRVHHGNIHDCVGLVTNVRIANLQVASFPSAAIVDITSLGANARRLFGS